MLIIMTTSFVKKLWKDDTGSIEYLYISIKDNREISAYNKRDDK